LHLKNLERLKSDHDDVKEKATSREGKKKLKSGQATAQKILNAGIFLKKGKSLKIRGYKIDVETETKEKWEDNHQQGRISSARGPL